MRITVHPGPITTKVTWKEVVAIKTLSEEFISSINPAADMKCVYALLRLRTISRAAWKQVKKSKADTTLSMIPYDLLILHQLIGTGCTNKEGGSKEVQEVLETLFVKLTMLLVKEDA